ncbi:DUF4825 domain-containing protein [Niallia sp. 01092]|uniref:DUF4825 domain-containing protein n=1 Tax=unclassified Niallia TaxID=2837522 RepID=UPI003FCFF2CB
MNKSGVLIAGLLVSWLLMFIVVQFIINSKKHAAAEHYVINQRRPLTHDLEYILPYKQPYMGNASNVIILFNHLPLNEVEKDFQLLSDIFTIKVNYHLPSTEIGTKLVNQSIIYNSTATFLLIGNLEKIELGFLDKSVIVNREMVKKLYKDFDRLLKSKKVWEQQVRSLLMDEYYIENGLGSLS